MARKRPDGTGVKEMWRANEPVPNWERQYGFTQFAMTLNEPDESEWRGREGGREGGREKERERRGEILTALWNAKEREWEGGKKGAGRYIGGRRKRKEARESGVYIVATY